MGVSYAGHVCSARQRRLVLADAVEFKQRGERAHKIEFAHAVARQESGRQEVQTGAGAGVGRPPVYSWPGLCANALNQTEVLHRMLSSASRIEKMRGVSRES